MNRRQRKKALSPSRRDNRREYPIALEYDMTTRTLNVTFSSRGKPIPAPQFAAVLRATGHFTETTVDGCTNFKPIEEDHQ